MRSETQCPNMMRAYFRSTFDHEGIAHHVSHLTTLLVGVCYDFAPRVKTVHFNIHLHEKPHKTDGSRSNEVSALKRNDGKLRRHRSKEISPGRQRSLRQEGVFSGRCPPFT